MSDGFATWRFIWNTWWVDSSVVLVFIYNDFGNCVQEEINMESLLENKLGFLIRVLELPAPVTEYKFIKNRRFRFDFAWPDLKIAVEVEGGTYRYGRHQRPGGYENDCVKYSLAALLGWKVVRVTSGMITDGRAEALLECAFGRRLFDDIVKKKGDKNA